MEAIYFGNDSGWWREKPADDNKLGPWVMADIENGRPVCSAQISARDSSVTLSNLCIPNVPYPHP